MSNGNVSKMAELHHMTTLPRPMPTFKTDEIVAKVRETIRPNRRLAAYEVAEEVNTSNMSATKLLIKI